MAAVVDAGFFSVAFADCLVYLIAVAFVFSVTSLGLLTPQKWAVQGMENIAARGMGFEAAIVPVLVLTVMGLLFFAAGVRLVKYE